MRNCQPEPTGTSATFCAMVTMNGSTGENAAATVATPRLMATAMSGGMPRAVQMSSRSGANATSSSDICSSAPPAAKTSADRGNHQQRRGPRTAAPARRPAARSAPVRSTTVKRAAREEDQRR